MDRNGPEHSEMDYYQEKGTDRNIQGQKWTETDRIGQKLTEKS